MSARSIAKFKILFALMLVCSIGLATGWKAAVQAVPPPEDQPEEILRTEIILEARSPQDGKPLTAAEYAELQAQLEEEARRIGSVPPQLRELVTLLKIRRVLRTILPFLP
ncbi:MAG: hypothetical protein MUF72_01470 [Elainella sp. Prado103]|jgi:hypothetical protein|nr:hypothetical protein [Elainella sp. Prado103]